MREHLYNRLINDMSLRSLARKLAGDKHEDLVQEIALVICEKNEDELIKLSEYFNFWAVRTMINMTGPRAKMSKYQEVNGVDYIDTPSEEYDTSIDELLEKIDKELSKMHWYERRLFLAYIEEGTMRKLSAATELPLNTVARTVKQVKDRIRCSLR